MLTIKIETDGGRDGLSDGNPHIIFDAVPDLAGVKNYCEGYIQFKTAEAAKTGVVAIRDAGFGAELVDGQIQNSNHGSWYVNSCAESDA